MYPRLTGLVAAAYTPLHADGSLNLSLVEPMVEHLLRFPWVLPVRRYANPSELIDGIDRLIIEPAETLAGRVKPVPTAP